jgi:hypothetical protein
MDASLTQEDNACGKDACKCCSESSREKATEKWCPRGIQGEGREEQTELSVRCPHLFAKTGLEGSQEVGATDAMSGQLKQTTK